MNEKVSFQFTISPGARKPKSMSKPPNEKEEEIPCLSLAPFTPNVKMCFENVVIGTLRTQKLLLENPNPKDIEVTINNLPSPEQQVKLNWYKQLIAAGETVMLEITWTPIAEEAFRHIFTFEVGRFLKKDVAVSFKSVPVKRPKSMKSTKQGKYTVISKKIKSPPKKMISPKTSSHKTNIFPRKQPSSTKQKQNILINKSSIQIVNGTWNKENLNPCLQSISVPQLTYCGTDSFHSSKNATFNIESINNDSRRSTYTVKTLTSNVQKYAQGDVYNDSLEDSPNQPKHSPTNCFTYEVSEQISTKATSVLHALNVTPVLNNVNTIKSKLDSSLFTFTPIKPTSTEFIPNLCSTTTKSNNNSDTKKHQSANFKNSESKPIEIIINDENSLGNISSETYIKGNISSETYVKGNISSETYNLNGNLSCGLPLTSIKDNSIDNLNGVDPISHFAKIELAPFKSALFEESFSDVDTSTLSPITKDSSVVHQANMSGDNIKNIIAANLWCSDKNKNIDSVNRKLSIISEETFSDSRSLKRKSAALFDVSPPKKLVLDGSKRQSDHFPNLKWNKSKPVPIKQVVRRSVEYLDPFMTVCLYHDTQWMEEQEIRFQKWLNALLTPHAELDSAIDVHPVDVAKLWQQCKNKPVPMAPTKEVISNEYHTNKRLEALRKAATDLFKSRELSEILLKVQTMIESDKLSIRKDRDVHLDLGLQAEVMTLFLSYNPLWLRIGLETIYGVTIQLASNSDIMGLSSFIMHRFFKDPYLVKKHKTIHTPKYVVDIKKFILKKFLTLVYFLDVAKTKVLIAHDPCLFCKNAPVKESREVLLRFSKELLSAVGDVTKFLRYAGYVVSHKQKYIHEFDYSVMHLGTDLRDGVRLTKVMEIILMEAGMMDNLRVPAISRLQKIHNMKIVFDALQKAEFEIVGEISLKDIVDGHHEKTLSFLWQIIYKFQAPRFIKASTVIQTWWKSLSIVIKRRIVFKKKSCGAVKIQQWYRRQKMASKLEALIPVIKGYLIQNKLEMNTIKIQSYYRMLIQKRNYNKLRYTVICLQKYIRGYLVRYNNQKKVNAVIKIQAYIRMWIARNQYCQLRAAAIHIQQIYRGNRLALAQQNTYVKLKTQVVFIQILFRANREMKIVKERYFTLKSATVTIQRHFRAIRQMRIERSKYLKHKAAALVIQSRFRGLTQMKMEQNKYQRLRNACIYIQRHLRAHKLMKTERIKYQILKRSAIVIQQHIRAANKMKIEREHFKKLKETTRMIQSRFRARKAMVIESTKFRKLQKAALTIQRIYRAKRAGRIEHAKFLALKTTSINIQRRFRANKLMKMELKSFQALRKSAIVLQTRFRANQAMKFERTRFEKLKRAAKTMQVKFRGTKLMKKDRMEYLKLKQVTINIQERYRAQKAMNIESKRYTNLKVASIAMQRRFRANQAMKLEQTQFKKLKQSAQILQSRFKANRLMKKQHNYFLKLRKSVIDIQRRFRANKAMKLQREQYQHLRKAVMIIQNRFRANRAMKIEQAKFNQLQKACTIIQIKFKANRLMRTEFAKFQEMKKAAIIIQRRFRANRIMQINRTHFLEQKMAAIKIQRKFRANQKMKVQFIQYEILKEATTSLQARFRAQRSMRSERRKYLKLKNAAIIIQRRFRAKVAMRTECSKYQKLKQAATILQTRYRANKLMKINHSEYLQLKRSVINIQRRFRANCQMKQDAAEFHQLKSAAIVLQRRFRAIKTMKVERSKFLQLKGIIIFTQRKFRATLLMKVCVTEFQQLKDAAIILQQRFKANNVMRIERGRFLELQKAVCVIQRRFRANQNMKVECTRYQSMKKAVITIQRRYRANRKMKAEHLKFLELKNAVINVQRRFRANKKMKVDSTKYKLLKNAVITTQRSYRSRRIMRIDRDKFLNLRKAAITIQERFRAYSNMKIENYKFQRIRQAAIVIQTRYRATKAMQRDCLEFFAMKRAVILLQKHFRRLKEVQVERGQFLNVLRARQGAALKIQTIWRGHHTRKQHPEIRKIRETVTEITAKASPHDTLGNRRERALQKLISETPTLLQIIRALEDLEFITRRCTKTCVQMSRLLSEQLYITISSTNRSPAEMQACTVATSILINFCKYQPASSTAWIPEYMDSIITVMSHCCDKEEKLFPYLCTLLWLFAHSEEHKKVILSIPKCSHKFMKMKTLCLRKHKMVSLHQHKTASYFSSYSNLMEPSLLPDWGLEYLDRPRTFNNSLHGFKCVLKILGLDGLK